ncbi:hypothetical protein ACQW02_02835 [Humitalea sp. 24SJ18S-53]|uniref:hypothetical protein n=1 Tax=Humitalea sp. 24SJ18S-53 TaxID=3422307 RepID=UPI003D66F900
MALLVLAGCAAPGGAPAGAGRATGPRPTLEAQVDRLPSDLAGFRRGPVTDFEARAPGYGRGVEYTSGGRAAVASVALYDRGLATVPADPADPAMLAELETAVREATALPPRTTGRALAEQRRMTVPAPGGPGLACADLAGNFGRTPIERLVCIGAAAGRYVKIQVTMPDRRPPVADATAFVAAAAGAARGG